MKKWKEVPFEEPAADAPETVVEEAADSTAPEEPQAPELEVIETLDYKALYEASDKQRAELMDRLMRTMADFDNFRKRVAKEKLTIFDDGARDALEKLLPVFDNLDRAMEAPEGTGDSLRKGIEMTQRQLGEILKNAGLEPVPAVGQPFDPNMHHAVAHVEDEAVGESVVVAELLKGYKYKDKVLRPSMVKVAN
ncbi:MAG: nucleotide exchange factor GrpE [Clostridiales bacterium]|nr:nucleotide exchange factor GrpE [Clostridiales bacterium]